MISLALLIALAAADAGAPDAGIPEPQISRELAQEILFLSDEAKLVPKCDEGPERAQIVCLISARYAKDPAAAKIAVNLYEKSGTVAGVLPAQPFDGGYRGKLKLIPKLPVGPLRTHLEWSAIALLDFEDFFKKLGGTPNYRWRALDYRFFESVKRRTPSAFAVDWSVSYNTSGSLFGSEAGVRGTLFHEIFHLNDQERRNWSYRVLSPIFDAIVAKCGTKIECLKPYVADSIIVKGGTYYAFQPGNGVGEYGADLARRYYVENRAVLHGEKVAHPFKCGTPENKKAWALIVQEFFGGVDLVPACLLR